ncbi:MAG: fibronectin type III domain-containing protein [Lachnospiraceae bacterium]|nr:fibronectin type III domain-containing protein [Lachnospiraceae bacterium]
MTDSSSKNIIGLNGQPYRTAGEGSCVNGDIELNLTGCSGLGVYGYTDFTDDDYGEVNQVTGKSTIRMKNCNFRTLSDKSYNCGEEDISTTSVAYLEDTTIVDSYDDPACVNEVHVKGHLIGGIAANDIRLEENAKVTGNIAVYKVISGQGEFWSYESSIGFAADAKPAAGTKIKIVPVKKSTNAAAPYVPYNKTEQLKNRIGIWFLSKENPDLYRNYFTCDYNKLESISSNGYRTELRVKNAVACNGSHNWAKAADCGWSDIEMYASMYDKEANHSEYGKETYYCTACLAYEVRNTPKKVEHDYVVTEVVEPTTEHVGYTVYYCRYTDCNEHYKGNFTDPLPKPSTDTDKKPTTDTDQKPSTDTDQKQSTDTDQKPSTDTDKKPVTNTTKKPVKKTYIAVSKLKVTLTSKVTYNGKAQKPSVVVKYGSKKLKNGTDYKLSYKNNKNIGTATITLTGKGSYQGTRKLTFGILPKKAVLTDVRSKKAKTAQVKWRKDTSASGYVIYYSTDPKFKKGVKKLTISKNKTTSTTVKNLKAKKTYYVRAASYKKTGGKTYNGSYSATKKVRIK